MIDPAQQSLLDGSLALARASARARNWVARISLTATSVANESQSLIEATRRAENLARKLSGSSQRRSSAGVFGPSQAGKSYLVSVLGRSKDKPLLADFAGTTKNFIQEINPEGGKESTGLVTRFTIVRGTRDAQHCVELRLLTETDLVKIIGNSFMSDFNQHNRKLGLPTEDEIRASIAGLERQVGGVATHLDEITMFDVGEYFKSNFSTSIGPLSRAGYWDALTHFGHKLDANRRAEMYGLLWGGSKDLTDVFVLLLQSLEALGHAVTARAAIDCLVPRTRSIIDVEVLKQHLGTPEDLLDTVSVVPELPRGGDGPVVNVARATLTALVAEIKVVMAEKPWNFFEHTDLLDFPGARAREQMSDLPADGQERAYCVRNMLLRGKIAYLFQRYTEERELTSMLLCMPPSNQEVKDLTSLVGKWVSQTQGDTAQARAQLPCSLFFVLTMFDKELVAKPGDSPESWRNRFDTRLEASMYQLYKQEDWLQNWNGKPFANTYFLRNPGFELEGMFVYGHVADVPNGLRSEVGLAPQAVERLTAYRLGMIDSERSRKHFHHPELAWDSAMELNDGGVSYLVNNLERVLSPKLKTRQLAGRLVDQGKLLDGRLRRFYEAGDEASRREKQAKLVDVRKRLYKACSARYFRNFVQLLACMKLLEADVRGAFLNVASLKIDDAPAAQDAAKPVEADPLDEDPWADAPAEPSASPQARVSVRKQRDRADHFAAQVLNLWTGRVRGVASNAGALGAMGIDPSLVAALADELVICAHRRELAERIADRVRTQVAAANVRWDEVADRCAGIATMMVNDHVTYLGFGELPESQRPAVPEPPKERQRGVFTPPPLPPRGSIPSLGETRVSLEREYFLDWGYALRQLGLDNMSFAGGREIDESDNRALGEILAELAPSLQVSVE